jgi:hypothetical protein
LERFIHRLRITHYISEIVDALRKAGRDAQNQPDRGEQKWKMIRFMSVQLSIHG